jgi:F0F1-type ATP synthase epsilon subunit
VLPGRPDLIAALAPGLMLFEDDESEAFVANAGGMLDLESGVCRVVLRSAVITRSSDDIGDAIARQREARQLQISTEGALLDALLSEALRRATESEPEQWSRPR